MKENENNGALCLHLRLEPLSMRGALTKAELANYKAGLLFRELKLVTEFVAHLFCHGHEVRSWRRLWRDGANCRLCHSYVLWGWRLHDFIGNPNLHLYFGPVYTMDHEVGPWKMAFSQDGLTSWSGFFKTKSFAKLFGPSLGVHRMWTKRNNAHASKSERVDFFDILSKRVVLEKEKKIQIWPFSCLFLSSSSLPQKNSLKFYYSSISLPWAPAFFCHATSFAFPTAKPVGPCQRII